MIILLGYMGSGKSSISEFLQAKHNLKCCDLDDYIESKENKSIDKIFKDHGEIYFRKREHQLLNEILDQKSVDVLSLGGGTPCYAGNMDVLNAHNVKSIYLKVDLDELTNRLFKNKSSRPLIKDVEDEVQLKDFIRKHLFEREFYYRQAKHIINVTDLSIAEASETLLKL